MASGDILVFMIRKANLEHLRQYLAWLVKTGLPQKGHFLARVGGIGNSGDRSVSILVRLKGGVKWIG